MYICIYREIYIHTHIQPDEEIEKRRRKETVKER